MRNQPYHQPAPVGVKAHRIADLLERFGVNTFSSMDGSSNRWGSWPADYSPASVVTGLKWLTAGSGLTIQCREYHYADRDWQAAWCSKIYAETGTTFTLAVGAGGGVSDANSLIDLTVGSPAWLKWVEGINEPNNDFGSGAQPTSEVVGVQTTLMDRLGASPDVNVMGPSVVFGLPYPEGYITPPYLSDKEIADVKNKMKVSNGHFYPPTQVDQADGSSRGGAFRDVVAGLRAAYGNLPVAITEWHPTLYNTQGHALDPKYDAYYAPCFFLSAFREGVVGWWWYALFDYGTTYLSGLFLKTGGVDPRPVANTIRAMFHLTGDVGIGKRTFTPGSLAFTVKGLPTPPADAPNTRGQTMLFQNSRGTYFLFVWDARSEPEGTGVPVTVTFNKPPASVTDYKISGDSPELPIHRSVRSASTMVNLNGSVHLLVIVP